MPRTPLDQRLQTRTSRLRLKPRRNPYFRSIAEGLAVGYRRIKDKAGTWIVRRYVNAGRYEFHRIGTADDYADADGDNVMSYPQAVEMARKWFLHEARRERAGFDRDQSDLTVADAIRLYLQDYQRRGGKGLDSTRYTVNAHIIPSLGEVRLAKLNRRIIESWIDEIATSGARCRTAIGQPQNIIDFNPDDKEMVRRRRATTNRVWTVLRAALNYALQRGLVDSRAAWEGVRPFRETVKSRARFLTDGELRRLSNACDTDLRSLVLGAVMTGCRYGELTRMTVADLDTTAGVVHVSVSKSGTPRVIPLNDEGQRFFSDLTAGRKPTAPLFLRLSGKPWKRAEQHRPMRAASERAKIDPPVNFHSLRHAYASRFVMAGAPLAVVAEVLGHANTRMTERHYAHLQPSYVANTVRDLYAPLGIVSGSNVVRLK